MTTGYDAVEVAALPPGGGFYLAYLDGAWPTYAAVKARFPTSNIVTVTVTGNLAADIVDVESGDVTPQDAAAWLRAGKGKGVYSDTSTKPALDVACAGLSWWWFAADPTGVPHIVPGSLATQYAWPGHGSPGNYDISQAVTFPNPPPPPAPIPTHSQESNMIASTPSGNGYWILHSDGSVWSYGDAQYFGGLNPGAPVGGGAMPAGVTAISIESHPGGEGYWILSSVHAVYAFGAAPYHGAPSS